MANTTTWALTYPTTANNITPLATHFANLANSADTAITNLKNQFGAYIGTDAQRLALTAPQRRDGVEWFSTDTDRTWKFDGTNWLSNDMGVYLIAPTAPVNATVDSSGLIIPTVGAKSISVNNVFSSRFRKYRLDYYYYTGDQNGNWIRLRLAGADSAGANYNYQALYGVSGTTFAATTGLATQHGVAAASGSGHFGHVNISNPASTTNLVQKTFDGVDTGVSNASITNFGGWLGNNDTTAFDGFTFSLSTLTGAGFSAGAWFKLTAIA